MAERRVAGPGSEVQSSLVRSRITDVQTDQLIDNLNKEQYLEWPPVRERIGICCSGGGIRSASFSLGALQVFRKSGLLDEAEYLSAVSGGAYISIAHTALVGLTIDDHDPASGEDPFAELPPWAPHSPEEKNLRDHSTYLAAGTGGKVWMLLNILYGTARQLLPFAAAIYFFGLFLGWLYEPWLKDALETGESATFDAAWKATVGVFATAGLVLLARQVWQQKDAPDGAILERLRVTTMKLVKLGAVVAFFSFILPNVLQFAADPPSFLGWASLKTLAGVEVGGLTLTAILGWLAKKGIFARAIPILVPILGPLVIALPLFASVKLGIERGPHGAPFYWWIASLVLMVVVWLSLDLVTPSMHLFYRERLSTVFIGLRRTVGNRIRFAQPPWSVPVRFSQMQNSPNRGTRLPKLVVCAAVNVASDVPPGRLAASFTFEQDRSGSPLTGYVPTTQLEEASSQGKLTLPAMMAISGAAVSPSMGKATRASYRFLMALFNVRLGTWIPNPSRLEEVTGIESSTADKSGPSLLAARIYRKARRPGVSYLVREAFGINDVSTPYIYVSDGGHWDNLGLVELLRRGCSQIVCLDASGDAPGRYDTVGEAIALARSELGVEIEIECNALSPYGDEADEGEHPDYSAANHVIGTIVYPNKSRGVLILAKTVLTATAPLDVRSFHEKDKRFPRHSTGDQLFGDQQFESYRALGRHVGKQALDSLNAVRTANGLAAISP